MKLVFINFSMKCVLVEHLFKLVNVNTFLSKLGQS
jgi:hypothetical protein